MPSRPASRPRCSCSAPSSGLICSSVWVVKDSGRAPYFSWFASVVAVAWVKLPVIEACPPVIGSFADGAEITRLSSTIANWFCGGWREYRRGVLSRNLREPSPSNCSRTSQTLVVEPFGPGCRPAVESEMSVPLTSTGPRMYFTEPLFSQATTGFFGSSTRDCSAVRSTQSCVVNSCCSAGVICDRSLGFDGCGAGVEDAEGRGVAEAEGDADGVPAAVPADVLFSSAGGTTPWSELAVGDAEARPLGDAGAVAVADGVADLLTDGRPEGVADPDGVGVAGGWAP